MAIKNKAVLNFKFYCLLNLIVILNNDCRSVFSWPLVENSLKSTEASEISKNLFPEHPSINSRLNCGTSQFSCNDSCIPLAWKCDKTADCKDGSDELDCIYHDCDKDAFKCANGKCIPKNLLCDSEDDCGDKSDEVNCKITCRPSQFTCSIGNKCIDKTLRCNGITDCPDGSDEKDCGHECLKTEFRCDDGTCIDKVFHCDQDFDCLDQSDEKNCPDTVCASNQFTCNDGKCIADLYRCDGNMDCKDRSDELGCPLVKNIICKDKDWLCHDKLECIHSHWKCDGSPDCKDGSDEKNCMYNATCRLNQFRCNSTGLCIPSYMRCNGVHECSDHSDEIHCDTKLNITSDAKHERLESSANLMNLLNFWANRITNLLTERVGLNNDSKMEKVLKTKTLSPIGLTIVAENVKVYWFDGTTRTLATLNELDKENP